MARCGKLLRGRAGNKVSTEVGVDGLWAAVRPFPSPGCPELVQTLLPVSRSRFPLGSTMALMTVGWGQRISHGGSSGRVALQPPLACPGAGPHPPSSCFCTRRSSFRMELISWGRKGGWVRQDHRASPPGLGWAGPCLTLSTRPHLVGRLQDGHLVLGIDPGLQVLPRPARVLEQDPDRGGDRTDGGCRDQA